MAQFIGKPTRYLSFGSVKIFAPPKDIPCGRNQIFCQPTEQNDDITFQFLAAETDNLVTDGTFPNGSHDSICGVQSWCGSGWGIVSLTAVHTPGSTNPLQQNSIFTLNDFFKIEFTVTGRTVGSFQVANSCVVIDFFSGINGTYVRQFIAINTGNLQFVPSSNFDGAISNVSVIQVAKASDYDIDIFDIETGIKIDDVPAANVAGNTGNNIITVNFNWTDDVTVSNGCREIRIFLTSSLFEDDFTTDQGWFLAGVVGELLIAGGVMSYNTVGVNNLFALLNNVLTVGDEYTITYDVLNFVRGSVRVNAGETPGTIRSANGTFTETLICTGNSSLSFNFFPDAPGGVLDIDNIVIGKANDFDGQSECFDLQTSHDCSLLWVWSNNEDWGGYDYSIVSGGLIIQFEHKLRLISEFRGITYPSERNIGEDSGGTKKMDYVSLRKEKLLDIDFMPEYLHDAVAAFFAQDNRSINGTSYIMEEEYEPSPPNDSNNQHRNLMNATIELEETAQPELINRNE